MKEVRGVSAAPLRWFEADETWNGKWDAWGAVLDHGGPAPEMSGSMRCHCPRRPAPAARRRNMTFLMVRMVRSVK